ncbi:uncharacterized protein BXZ73DRAFT_92614 [Epithele typhae]|uniref:uncharacterized protein n=1 Tax=Epithele typhae TaxID=378194 RepID=UPI0020074EE4|nr:uncharacterized protein BXZ73DRAFT_92614 [Epithele typhae]KAH9915450.1 hypothetical protein BXZ73DRAFT_92614 [Epithele typhae]
MWLIDTEHHSLRKFDKPPSRYAILSHVWQSEEQDFQFVVSRSRGDRSIASKITECCLEWVWIDTCCIDKTNSVELSEAINSMYKWYSGADICFAYLFDVPARANPAAAGSKFRLSVWFTRGWTLQELIAPKNLVFFSSNWTMLGTKEFFATLLQEITLIDIKVLRFHAPLSSISVAKRMSWASSRVTTRVEDAAYCLMGIFDINTPTIYGEGPRAFRRLQEEITKTSPRLCSSG